MDNWQDNRWLREHDVILSKLSDEELNFRKRFFLGGENYQIREKNKRKINPASIFLAKVARLFGLDGVHDVLNMLGNLKMTMQDYSDIIEANDYIEEMAQQRRDSVMMNSSADPMSKQSANARRKFAREVAKIADNYDLEDY